MSLAEPPGLKRPICLTTKKASGVNSTLNCRFGRLSYNMTGTGPAICLIHGFPLDSRMWDAIVPSLSKRYQVIAIDLPGFGDSSPPDSQISMRLFAEAVCTIFDTQQIDTACLVGLSMGGYVIWEFWKQFPDRVNRIVACCTRTASDSEVAARARRVTAIKILEAGTEHYVKEMAGRIISETSRKNDPHLFEQVVFQMGKASAQSVAATLIALAERPDRTACLPHISIPILVVGGEDDRITPAEEMRYWASQLPHVQIQFIPGCGHLPPMEYPQKFSELLLDFLDDRKQV